jgi:molybdate transport system substrate-binding protein
VKRNQVALQRRNIVQIARCAFPARTKIVDWPNHECGKALIAAAARRQAIAVIFGLASMSAGFLQWAEGAPAAAPDVKAAPMVFAAASMKTALDAVAVAWKANTGKTVKIAYGSSAILAKQIAQGAPADVFISADLKWMDYLQKDKLIRSETRRNRFGNKLVLIEQKDADIKLEITKDFDLAGAAGDDKIAVCVIHSCPAGIYAKEALESLGVFASVEPKLAQAVVGTFPESSHSPIIYPVAMVASSTNTPSFSWLIWPPRQATRIFVEQGFEILSK